MYLNGVGVDCLSLKGAEVCDVCEDGCGSEKSYMNRRVRVSGRVRVGGVLEEREVRDGSDVREMISELRGRCMVCWFGGLRENDEHELQKCRYMVRGCLYCQSLDHGGRECLEPLIRVTVW